MKESDIQRQILDYLALRRIFHYRNNSGAFVDSKKHFYRFGALGSPDIYLRDRRPLCGDRGQSCERKTIATPKGISRRTGKGRRALSQSRHASTERRSCSSLE